MRLKNRVAIITGAGRGMGRAMALRFVNEGGIVVAADKDLEPAEAVVNEIKALNGRAISIKTDVRKRAEVNCMVQAALDEFGTIDILMNNAGQGSRDKGTVFHKTMEEQWDFIMDTNLKGVFHCTQAVLPHMITRRYGRIISTASICGINATGSIVGKGIEYAVAKGGIIIFATALAKEVGQYGITVNCISPGPIRTGVVEVLPVLLETLRKRNYMGRLGETEDIANIAAFLASDEASWITGQNYVIDGGESLGW